MAANQLDIPYSSNIPYVSDLIYGSTYGIDLSYVSFRSHSGMAVVLHGFAQYGVHNENTNTVFKYIKCNRDKKNNKRSAMGIILGTGMAGV